MNTPFFEEDSEDEGIESVDSTTLLYEESLLSGISLIQRGSVAFFSFISCCFFGGHLWLGKGPPILRKHEKYSEHDSIVCYTESMVLMNLPDISNDQL